MADVTLDRLKPSARMRRLMESLPNDMRASFTDAQREALGEAISSRTWRRQSKGHLKSIASLEQRIARTRKELDEAEHDMRVSQYRSSFVRTVGRLKAELGELEAELTTAQKSYRDFRLEARRQGALPGWLR